MRGSEAKYIRDPDIDANACILVHRGQKSSLSSSLDLCLMGLELQTASSIPRKKYFCEKAKTDNGTNATAPASQLVRDSPERNFGSSIKVLLIVVNKHESDGKKSDQAPMKIRPTTVRVPHYLRRKILETRPFTLINQCCIFNFFRDSRKPRCIADGRGPIMATIHTLVQASCTCRLRPSSVQGTA